MKNFSYCERCFEKQRIIDRLTEENHLLKAKLYIQEKKKKEGFFGSSTPSSKIPLKSNTKENNQKKKGGALKGHKGSGRKRVSPDQADHIIPVPCEQNICDDCREELREIERTRNRAVVDMKPLKVEKILYTLAHKQCPRCHRVYRAKAPSVLPRSLFGNTLLTYVAISHYLQGIPLGTLCRQLRLHIGSLIGALHRLSDMFEPVMKHLKVEYRQAKVRHSDETGWRNDGNNGYVWLFSTTRVSIFLFGKTRAGCVVREMLGQDPLPGYLVVDRYNAYNQAPCKIQYCYAHLLREVEDLEKEFPDDVEVKAFVEALAPVLAYAMSLRSLPISDEQFYAQAIQVKMEITQISNHSAKHLGIRGIQDIFTKNKDRLYHWVNDRDVPAENNFSERQIRFAAIARKVSFGSQSDKGAKTRSIMTSILHTLQKRHPDVQAAFKQTLDLITENPKIDPYEALFGNLTVSHHKKTKSFSRPTEIRPLTISSQSPFVSRLSLSSTLFSPHSSLPP